MFRFARLVYLLLERIAAAMERQADYTEYVKGTYERREKLDAQDRIDAKARLKENDEYAARQEAMIRSVVENQRRLIAQHEESIARSKEHTEKCERWHRQHCGVPPDEAEVVN